MYIYFKKAAAFANTFFGYGVDGTSQIINIIKERLIKISRRKKNTC